MTRAPLGPWQVWWAEFDPQLGHEQAGRRPAIVVGTALACSLPNQLVLLVPCTSRDRGYAWHAPVTLAGRAGVAMVDQVKALDRRRLSKPHAAGTVPVDEREQIAFMLSQLIIQPGP